MFKITKYYVYVLTLLFSLQAFSDTYKLTLSGTLTFSKDTDTEFGEYITTTIDGVPYVNYYAGNKSFFGYLDSILSSLISREETRPETELNMKQTLVLIK